MHAIIVDSMDTGLENARALKQKAKEEVKQRKKAKARGQSTDVGIVVEITFEINVRDLQGQRAKASLVVGRVAEKELGKGKGKVALTVSRSTIGSVAMIMIIMAVGIQRLCVGSGRW